MLGQGEMGMAQKDVLVYKGRVKEVKEDLSRITHEEFESMKQEVTRINEELRERSQTSMLQLSQRAEQAMREFNQSISRRLHVVLNPAEALGKNDAAVPLPKEESPATVPEIGEQKTKTNKRFDMAFFKDGFYSTTSLAVSSIKGGVGKSSSAVSIAGAYAEMFPDNKVLLIDCDPQGNSSTALGCEEGEKGMYELFSANARLSSVMKQTSIPNLYVVPADPRLLQYQIRLQLGYSANPRINFLLKDRIEQFKQETKGNWFIIFDTRPDIGIYTLNAFIASDALVCPITPCEFALDAFSLVFDIVEFVNKYNPSLKLLGVFRSKWDKQSSTNTRLAEEEISKYGNLVLQATIPNQAAVPNAVRERVPVNYSKGNKNSGVSKAYKALLQEILDRWNRMEQIASVK